MGSMPSKINLSYNPLSVNDDIFIPVRNIKHNLFFKEEQIELFDKESDLSFKERIKNFFRKI